ncbi:phenolic glucoside malonyltransferase 2-like [Typha latifolia]|uniref:phenolic glucoside malonyltransferase 2-like n=1 Tax=Typha latifolia TaxID=4733 RepID=UPI003C301A88
MAFSSSLPPLRLLETSQISPAQGSIPQTSLPLTFFDVLWLAAGPVERLFFYPFPHTTSHFICSFLPTLKSSLSTTLQTFFPLAGTLRPIPGNDFKFELCYSDGDSISLTVAECVDGGFDILSGSDAREISNLRPFLPQLQKLGDSSSLLAIQVTVFPGDGVVIGTAVHHAACDGSSSIRFMHSWASACRTGCSAAESNMPIFDRSLIPDPRGLYTIMAEFILSIEQNKLPGLSEPDAVPADLFLASFTLTQSHIKKLKEAVLSKADGKNNKSFHLSTFVVTLAYIWVGFVRVREHFSPGLRKEAHLGFAVDFRARMEPSIPAAYFGNCVSPCLLEAIDVGDLVGRDGLRVASEAIGRAIEGLSVGLKRAHEWPTIFKQIMKEPLMTVAGSPKFRVYDVDFGWGRPEKVEILSIEKSGAISLAESWEDPGGIEIGFVLPKHEVEYVENYLANGLKTLSDDL